MQDIKENSKDIQTDNQIIPRERIASIILDENSKTVLYSLGKPNSVDAAMCKAVYTWNEG